MAQASRNGALKDRQFSLLVGFVISVGKSKQRIKLEHFPFLFSVIGRWWDVKKKKMGRIDPPRLGAFSWCTFSFGSCENIYHLLRKRE